MLPSSGPLDPSPGLSVNVLSHPHHLILPSKLPLPISTTPKRPPTARLQLRYTPSSESFALPNIKSITTALLIESYASIKPNTSYPLKANQSLHSQPSNFTTSTIPLCTQGIAPSQWSRYGGNNSLANHYLTDVEVPLLLPDNKELVPTFHSCLVSRTYELVFEVRYRGGKGFFEKDQKLKAVVPVRLVTEARLESTLVEDEVLRLPAYSEEPQAEEPQQSVDPQVAGFDHCLEVEDLPSPPPAYEGMNAKAERKSRGSGCKEPSTQGSEALYLLYR